ncbi:MAG: T9SS type A sorting domain-containing protein [Lentimicrobium sp.]|nr:T9SS type A sorting domain-containing protein [Lentimicrobium sp.]
MLKPSGKSLSNNHAGQKVLQGKPVNNTLDISKLRPGMYIIEMVANQRKVRKKLMVE